MTLFAQANAFKCHWILFKRQQVSQNETSKTFLSLDERIKAYRKLRIAKPDIKLIEVGKSSYQILGILGKGTSVVYLAHNSDGHLVQIKKIISDGQWAYSLFYEMTVSRFYAEKGIRVPKILDFEFKDIYDDGHKIGSSAILVKEYFEGITQNELSASRDFSDQEKMFLQSKFNTVSDRLRSTHKHFARWLVSMQINLHENSFPELNRLIQNGDIKGSNLLYAPSVQDVVPFDI